MSQTASPSLPAHPAPAPALALAVVPPAASALPPQPLAAWQLRAVVLRRRDRARQLGNIATRSATATHTQRTPQERHDEPHGDDGA